MLCRKAPYVILSEAKNLIFSQGIEILHPDKSGFRMTKNNVFDRTIER